MCHCQTSFQLRVIRAFRSTLEDMEEKRSVHSIHSLRSTRSMLNRPMSDISYIDEETVCGSNARGQSFSVAGGGSSSFNGGGLLAAPRHGMTASQLRNKPSSGSEGSSSSSANFASRNNYLKVEGQTYRVCRTVGRQESATAAATTNGGGGGNVTLAAVRRTSDAQTQSAESSFNEDAAENPLPPQQQQQQIPAVAPIQQQQQQSFDMSCATTNTSFQQQQAGSMRMAGPGLNNDDFAYAATYVHVVGVPSSSRGPSPVMLGPAPVQYSMAGAMGGPTHLLPSPMYSAVNYGYDPTYCQYLGQAADGYQYELVRRPSMGAPPSPIPPPQPAPPPPALSGHHDLLMPSQYNSRGQSGSLLVPSTSPVPHYTQQHHHPGLSSMQGSFDSVGGPPTTPIFMQPASPRPPYHHQQQPHMYSSSGAPSYSTTPHRVSSMSGGGQPAGHPHDWGPPTSSDIPKLIHETSI